MRKSNRVDRRTIKHKENKMGRPLNKKYFGNRNIGTNGYTPAVGGNYGGDDGIGGEGVASYGTIVAGSGWTTAPTVTFSAPNIAGGVSVAGTVHYKALSFATTANGTGYAVGNILEVDTGTATTKARAPVASIVVVGVPTVANGGSLYDVVGSVGDRVTFTNAGLSTPLIVEITAVSGSSATTVEVVQAGVWNGSGAPTTTTGWTAVTSDGPTDNNGSGLVLNLVWGVYAFGAVSVAGDYTVFPTTGTGGTLTSISPATGTGAKADITMGLLSVEITQKGSGYTIPSDAAISFSGATSAAATAVLTTDSGGFLGSGNNVGGDVNAATQQDNAIIIRANTADAGAKIGDIRKQKGSRRYQVKTADGIAIVKLVADDTPAVGEAYITATDLGGATYWVTKLTAHRATIVPKGDGSPQFPLVNGEPQHVGWTFGTAVAPATNVLGIVKIENA